MFLLMDLGRKHMISHYIFTTCIVHTTVQKDKRKF